MILTDLDHINLAMMVASTQLIGYDEDKYVNNNS